MKKSNAVVILGTAHRAREVGKCSPDKRLREYRYSRDRVAGIKAKLEALGYMVFVDMEADDLPVKMQSGSASQERNRELNMRVNLVNALCAKFGKENCIYVSVHVDAAGGDGKWHDARGFSVRVGSKAGEHSKRLGRIFCVTAETAGLMGNRSIPPEKYWSQNLYVLNKTACPAVLTENLFQDNKSDVDFLLSDEGKHAVERLHVEAICKYMEGV
ncbi:N-acetylmuramoyl-L-alanine amidase [Prevotella sp. OH937_COT-195]|uniref:N-acetylmuramoyl-L-alanine amidase n=1 Tax=Prevotella sp. OH937_COT-195 TaxID=2491051 RepID=UPI000F653312|nr:N-acetylmuramoyl-L-alanine amidase [Prevotella sp. OH937_COT-195]RRC97022.1 N-acetylmuramoyl-L-alanine amidase [Prevotella sp. OH937_COT-195]